MLVSKVSAQKKGGKSYDSYKYVFKFRWYVEQPPSPPPPRGDYTWNWEKTSGNFECS